LSQRSPAFPPHIPFWEKPDDGKPNIFNPPPPENLPPHPNEHWPPQPPLKTIWPAVTTGKGAEDWINYILGKGGQKIIKILQSEGGQPSYDSPPKSPQAPNKPQLPPIKIDIDKNF
jgi:hypothetical protein